MNVVFPRDPIGGEEASIRSQCQADRTEVFTADDDWFRLRSQRCTLRVNLKTVDPMVAP